ncbi:malonyl CoA-acyl carrier protein transacylase [Roseibium aquae]|uniref:Malonyl CoA-acyl carrier protein transacylase n=1 Tax=Roseibium aquae TaxID=1323746 RepID=A0A916WZZ0_9HYPH|nr:ACP S-malonyltransferase [Roseibium aquae]GGB43034.1 malonyl CoA-acyl carrier protein transacylase [Roseibium aquae]
MSFAFLFPGQGSQAVGMGKELAETFPEARAVFEEVDEALGQTLSALMWDGPESDLTLTANAQPALMAVSMATMRVLEARGLKLAETVSYVAGHSLGEYSALAAAGSLDVGTAARLLRIRGDAMQSAVPVGKGAMAALLGLEFDEAVKVAEEAAQGEVCQAANDNAPGQVVVSGHVAAVERAVEIAKARGAKRAMMLAVSAPFHCALMASAADAMADALANADIRPPVVPVVVNVLAAPVTDPSELRSRLVEQVTGTVRWRESMQWLTSNGVTQFAEIGAGKVLTGMMKRIERSATAQAVNSADDIDTLLQGLSA